jgi:hypothetical protein
MMSDVGGPTCGTRRMLNGAFPLKSPENPLSAGWLDGRADVFTRLWLSTVANVTRLHFD